MSSGAQPLPCVYCRRQPADPRWRPFCSERCKTADLAAWAGGAYRVPAEPAPDATESDEPGHDLSTER